MSRRARRLLTYEHHSEPLLTPAQFAARLAHHGLWATGVIVVGLGLGVAGYHWLAGLHWIDAGLNASMILSGMGPVDPLPTTGAKLFASGYALFSGVLFLAVSGLIFAPIIHRVLHKLHLDDPEN